MSEQFLRDSRRVLCRSSLFLLFPILALLKIMILWSTCGTSAVCPGNWLRLSKYNMKHFITARHDRSSYTSRTSSSRNDASDRGFYAPCNLSCNSSRMCSFPGSLIDRPSPPMHSSLEIASNATLKQSSVALVCRGARRNQCAGNVDVMQKEIRTGQTCFRRWPFKSSRIMTSVTGAARIKQQKVRTRFFWIGTSRGTSSFPESYSHATAGPTLPRRVLRRLALALKRSVSAYGSARVRRQRYGACGRGQRGIYLAHRRKCRCSGSLHRSSLEQRYCTGRHGPRVLL